MLAALLALVVALAPDGALVARWQAPPDQVVACLATADGNTIACATGTAGELRYGPGGRDAAYLSAFARGATVRLRIWRAGDNLPSIDQQTVVGFRSYLPQVYH